MEFSMENYQLGSHVIEQIYSNKVRALMVREGGRNERVGKRVRRHEARLRRQVWNCWHSKEGIWGVGMNEKGHRNHGAESYMENGWVDSDSEWDKNFLPLFLSKLEQLLSPFLLVLKLQIPLEHFLSLFPAPGSQPLLGHRRLGLRSTQNTKR